MERHRKHENYGELVWRLAKTDFQLRYHGSVLGYVWAILKPLLIFSILNFVFSSVFNPRTGGDDIYSLQLLSAIMLFNFFAEGTQAGMSSLLSKSQLVTKVFVPRWTIVFASTLNALFIFSLNLFVIIFFFAIKHFVPSIASVGIFLSFSLLMYLFIVALSLFLAPMFVRYRDVSMIWEVITTGLFYASPIIYPLLSMPPHVQRILIGHPVGYIIHYAKEGLVGRSYPDPLSTAFLFGIILVFLFLALIFFRSSSASIAENM